ncbi:hypothetical protein F5Y11DRAFT_311493 [Daldinia sp. FL1419]|nr:hypothetical protein F5Y11DRAFT_311493 [Daldinia sp. FL1419]
MAASSSSLSREGEDVGSVGAAEGSGGRGAKGSGGKTRPSFTDYWRRTKEAARHITFVASNPDQSAGPKKTDANPEGSTEQSEQSAQAKALARRQQVRKAQKQHRQRKVNYTKQLEMDIAKLRDLIEQTERDSLVLRGENEVIRRRLLGKGVPVPAPQIAPVPPPLNCGSEVSLPEFTINLIALNEALDKPMFQVQRVSSPSSWPSLSGFANDQTPSGTSSGFGDAGVGGRRVLTQSETDHAINFILELERVCWNHFHPSMYDHNDYDPAATEHGHSLMVSAMALRSAPPEAWAQISAEKDRQASQTQTHSHSHSHPPPPTAKPITSFPSPPSPSNPLTLSNLLGLATALNPNPSESAELAPVQAWFEIARLYGGVAALLHDTQRLARLRAELAAAVECVQYGAVIRRADLEGTLERVLGPPAEPMRGNPRDGVGAGVGVGVAPGPYSEGGWI